MSDKVKRKYVKHDHEERVMAIKKVLEEGWSIRAAARLINANHRQVSFWLSTYEKYGNLRPVRKHGSYSADFKRKVVSDIVLNSLTLQQAALKYWLPCASAVRTWKERYHKYGDAAYIVKPSSVRKPDMSEKKKDRNKIGNVAELASLRKEVEYLRAENAYLKKIAGLSKGKECPTNRERMTAIRLLRPKFRLSFLLKAAGMARSTFYYGAAAYGKDDKYATVIKLISEIYHLHKGRYGYRRIRLELKRKGYNLNGKTVLRLMGVCGLKSKVRPKKFRSYKGDVGRIAPNIMRRDFSTEAPNRKWVTDITQFTLLGQRCYLSTVMDLFNQEIVAYTISSSCSLKLVTTMLKKAFSTVKDLKGLMLHSDQGWHYQHANYRRMLSARGIVQSMSRKGNCLDNAVMENFFGHLKSELLYLHEFCSWEDFIRELKKYILYYNNDRIKVRFNGLSPIEYKNKYYNELI